MSIQALEQDLLLRPLEGVESSGFRTIERNDQGPWRAAEGELQSVMFPAPAGRKRIYYRFFLPLAHTRLSLRQGEKVLLSLRARDPGSSFQGFFEMALESPGNHTLQFVFEREPGAGFIPSDPAFSYTLSRFLLAPLEEEPPAPDPGLLRSMKTVLVTLPTWSICVPPMGVACLSAALRAKGVPVSVFDFNVTAWHALKHVRIAGEDLWAPRNAGYFRDEALFASTVLPSLREAMDTLVNQICALEPEVLGFTVFYTSLPCMEWIAKACKARLPNLKIVCGGPETGGANEEYRVAVLESSVMDVAAVGEGEATLLELLARWARKTSLQGCKGIIHRLECGLPVVEPARASLSFAEVPTPDYEDFDLSLYASPHALPVMISRGCVARCSFCSESRFWHKFRSSTAERAFAEIERLVSRFGINEIFFNDSLVNGNIDTLTELVERIIDSGLQIRWNGQARIDARMTTPLLEKMALSGCEFLSYGFESGSQKVVNLMEKRSTVELAREVIRNTHAAGIRTGLNVIVGFPGEEEDDFGLTMEFIRANLPFIDQVGINEMNVFVGVPVGDDPTRFGIAANFLSGTDWVSSDGRNTPSVRKDRLHRVMALVEEYGITKGVGSSSR